MRRILLSLSLLSSLAVVPAAWSQDVAPAVKANTKTNSQISLAASPSSVFNGTPVTLKADIQSTQGGPAPTGTVTFYSDGWPQGTATISQTTAQITVPTRGAAGGTYTLTAVYNGDKNYNSSWSNQAYVWVSCDSNSTSDMAASPSSLKPGGIVTFATDVSPNQGGPIPTGVVYFYEIHGTYLGQAQLIAGVATLYVSTTGITPGTYQIYSVYQGSAIYEMSTSETDTVVVE